jgi:hypothetical protein
MSDKPMSKAPVQGWILVAVTDAKEGSLVTFRCRGPGEKLDRNDQQSKSAAMWLACKVSGKRSCVATAAQVRKGDVVSIDGNLVMGAPWTTQDGQERQDLVLWVDDLRIWGLDAEPVAAPESEPAPADFADLPF